MTALILHPNTDCRPDPHRGRKLRSAALALVWLALAAAVPVGAVFVAASPAGDGASAPHVAPYIEAKVGRP
jgi:hypothetical protein